MFGDAGRCDSRLIRDVLVDPAAKKINKIYLRLVFAGILFSPLLLLSFQPSFEGYFQPEF